MSEFHYVHNDLYCEGIKVSTVSQAVGTPFYLYSHRALVNQYRKIQKALTQIHPLICFAMKSNDNLAVIKTMVDLGAGFDIVSIGELKKALRAKADPQRIVFASVGKTEEEIIYALKTGILLFNVESLPELKAIQRIAHRLGKIAPVALRINPEVAAPTHDFIATGTLENKFGLDLSTARNILKNLRAYPQIAMKGIHIHIGSQITDIEPFVKAIKKALHFIRALRQEGISLKYFNMGGGMGIAYKKEKPFNIQAFARCIVPLLEKTGLSLIMEPGRYIVGHAGIFVTKVLYVKNNGLKKFLIVDGGMNDLIRPTLYHAYHEIVPLKKRRTTKDIFDVVGPICESGDFFARNRRLPVMKAGDLLAVMTAGAYGYVMSSHYNVRGRVPEVLVKGRRFAVTRKRETFSDLVRGETIPQFLKS